MYRAGSAFIAVSPSFRGFQTKAAVEARKLRPIKIPVEYDHKNAVIGKPKAVRIPVKADTAAANAALRATEANASRLGRLRTRLQVDYSQVLAAEKRVTSLQSRLRALSTGRTLIQIGVVAAPLAIPAAAGLLGAAAGLGTIGTAVGAGAGIAAAIGLSQLNAAREQQKAIVTASEARVVALEGVEAAEQSLAAATASAAATSLSATRAVADAQRALADARRNQGRVARAAAAQVAGAQDLLKEAQSRVVASEDALHEARQQALRDLADLTARIRSNANEQESADLTLIAARERLAAAEENIFSSATDMRAARLEVAEAEARVSEARRQSQRDVEELAKAERRGIDASDPMVAAREQLVQARDDRAAARLELAEAQRSAQEARADAARAVADAERGLARARVDAAAAEAQASAQVADAQAGLTDAQTDLAAAETARSEALAKLTPAQKRMLRGLESLTGAWSAFLMLIDRPLGGFMVAGLKAVERALPGLAAFLKPVLRSLRGVMDMFGDAAASKGAQRFARIFGAFSGDILKDAGRGTRNLVAGFSHLLRAFMPLSRDMSKGLVSLTRRFRIWSAGLKDSDGFKGFIGYVRREGPKFLTMAKAIGGALIDVGVALAPLASKLMTGLTLFAGWISHLAEAHPWVIQLVGTLLVFGGILGLVTKAFVAVVLPIIRFVGFVFTLIKWVKIVVFNLKFLWFVLRANPIGLVITAIMVLVGLFKLAYGRSETFRRIVDATWSGIQRVISWAWERVIKPALKAFAGYFTDVLGPVIKFLWTGVVKPVFGWLGDKISDTWSGVIKPVFQALAGFISDTLPGAFHGGIDAIGRLWSGLQQLAAKPVNFVIDTIFNNGIRKVINAIPGLPDIPALPTVSWGSPYSGVPGSYRGPTGQSSTTPGVQRAGGGVLPGWSPGRDVHRFVSPTGGLLDLSGGEAVMRPEWTRAIGGGPVVNFLNAAARRGRGALAEAMAAVSRGGPHRRYFLGGVLPLAGGAVTGVHPLPYYGTGATWAGDLNSPGDLTSPPSLVKAWKDGVVAQRISLADSYGNHYLVNHAGKTSLYAHLSSFIAGVGQNVRAGQALGRVGQTGNASGAHLHFEVRGGNVLAGSGFAGAGAVGAGRGSVKGQYSGAIGAARNLAGNVSGWFRELVSMGGWGGLIKQMASSVLGGFRGWVNNKIPGPGPVPSIFDGGGQLHQGYTLAYHGARKPDKVLTDGQWRDLHAVAARRADGPAAFHIHDTDGQLMGTLYGVAGRANDSHDSWSEDRADAGMGSRR